MSGMKKYKNKTQPCIPVSYLNYEDQVHGVLSICSKHLKRNNFIASHVINNLNVLDSI